MSSASAILRRVRKDAGLTQTALSERAGIPQSVISDYERGRRDPSVSALNALLDSAGHTLIAVPEPGALRRVRRHAGELLEALAQLGATNVSVFGSVARGDERPDSDIDLLVDLDESVGIFNLLRMTSVAEEILGRRVDVVPRADLKDKVAKSVVHDEIPL